MLEDLGRRVAWFVRLRWLAIAGVLSASAVARFLLGFDFWVLPIVLVVAALAAANLGFHFWRRRRQDEPGLLLIARVQVMADLFALVLLLYFSGGVENPFSYYFIFHTIIAGILLPDKESILITTVAVVLYSGMVLLDYFGAAPHFPLTGFYQDPMWRQGSFVLVRLFVLATTLYIAQYFTASIRRRLNEKTDALAEANRQLQEADRNRVQSVLQVTHELRAPLGAVESLLDTIRKGYVGKCCDQCDARAVIERAYVRTKNLMTLTDDLLDLHKMELGSMVLHKTPLRLDRIVDEVVEDMLPSAVDKGVTISREGFADLPMVEVDAKSMTMVISNLVANAVKYNVSGGTVMVSARRREDGVEVAVADTGVGIPPAELPRVFDVFFQGENARKTKRMGVGLGLSLVKRIVEAHGGTITAESEPGKGSRFVVLIPTGNGAAPRQSPPYRGQDELPSS